MQEIQNTTPLLIPTLSTLTPQPSPPPPTILFLLIIIITTIIIIIIIINNKVYNKLSQQDDPM